MEDNLNKIEDQPLPDSSAEEKANAEFQVSVDALGTQLVRKFQLSGNQFNALELEVRVFILIEQVNMLTKIIQQLTGSYSDVQLTQQMTLQVGALSKALGDSLTAAPRIAVPNGPAPRVNGSRHN